MAHRILILWGPPGSGKTTLGRRIARFLGWSFVDLDRELERTTGIPVSRWFAERREEAFRREESRLMERFLQKSQVVLAPGGGALVDARWDRLLQRDDICWMTLQAPLNILLQRLKKDRAVRPLLHPHPEKRLRKLLQHRAQAYRRGIQVDAHAPIRLAGARVLQHLSWISPLSLRVPSHPVILGHAPEPPEEATLLTHPHLLKLWEQFSRTPSHVIHVPPGERYKTLTTYRRVVRKMRQRPHLRTQPLWVLGGGVLGDLGGFVAATYARGIPLVLIPTTLLAMVDAHIGGKNGLDEGEKNLLGTVRMPNQVFVDPHFLWTLPRPYFREGLVELLKTLLLDPEGFPIPSSDHLRNPGLKHLLPMLQRAIEIKGWLVHQDPEDHGVRQVLNLGHTLGHALEAWSRYRIRHGMAVAWGMIRELWMGVAAGLTPEQLAEDITDRLSQGRLLPDIAPPPWEQLLPHLLRDKKRASRGSLTLIFLRAPGAPLRHTMSLEEARRLYKISLDLYRA